MGHTYRSQIWGYSWRDPLGRFGMTQFVDVGPETTIWTFDPLCWSTNLLLCRKNPNVHFVVSPILSDTLCWFGSNNESTICTIDQFCWCGWLFLKSTFLTVDKFCWFVVDTESTIFVNWPDLTKSTGRLTYSNQSSGRLKKCYGFAGSLTPRQDFQIHRQKFRPI